MTENEVWKDVVGYEGLYKVSDRGNIYSVERKDSMGRKIGGRILKPLDRTDGYLRVSLCKNSTTETKYVHRVVAEAFILNPNGLPQINHRDEIKDNNNVENLEWCTSKYNTDYGTRNERLRKKVRAVDVETGKVVKFNSTHEAGRKGYNSASVSSACRGVYKSGSGRLIGDGHLYRGHKWYYVKEVAE